MKLYPLLYEAAKGAEDALKKRLVIYGENRGTYNTITLFSPFAFSKIIKRIEQEEGLFDPSTHTDLIIKKAAKQATIGKISYGLVVDNNNDFAQVTSSAAIGGFGPLIYQIAMYQHPNLWLTSDNSLKPASEKVWNKMFELSNQGMYERKFLGKISKDELLMRAQGVGNVVLEPYINDLLKNAKRPTEEVFLDWLKENNLKPEQFGYLWAYKKSQHDPKIEELFNGGERFIQQAEDVFNMSKEDLKDIITGSGTKLFLGLYGSQASYTEE